MNPTTPATTTTMESLDLNGLAKSLPPSNFEKAEKELLNNFKAAALSITTLYRSSRHASKRAYNAGYASACQDLMIMIQQGVSTGGIAPTDHNAPSDEMTVGRILDWIEARIEAVKSREEEEDEDEEREKERERARVTPPSTRSDAHRDAHTFPSTSSHKPSQTASTSFRPDDGPPPPAPLTPHSPVLSNNVNLPNYPSSPSPIMAPTKPTITSANARITKARPFNARKDVSDSTSIPLISSTSSPLGPSENVFRVPAITPITTLPDTDFSAGAKRRHAVMMMLDATPSMAAVDVLPPSGGSAPSAVTSSGNSRRRTRSQRSAGHVQLPAQLNDSMDVEEDGPQRKRIARR